MTNRLLKYNIPVKYEEGSPRKGGKKCVETGVTLCANSSMIPTGGTCSLDDKRCKKNEDKEVAELLTEYFPPVRYLEMNNNWVKTIKTQQCTALEVANLQNEITRLLKIRSAKKIPLCRIRSDVLFDALNEVLRQLVIENPETGKLFKRIIISTENEIEAYETLLRNSESMTSRKAILGMFWREEGTKKMADLEQVKRQMEVQVAELKQRVDHLEKKNQEYKVKREKLRADELKYLKWRQEQLKMQIDQSLACRRVEKTE